MKVGENISQTLMEESLLLFLEQLGINSTIFENIIYSKFDVIYTFSPYFRF